MTTQRLVFFILIMKHLKELQNNRTGVRSCNSTFVSNGIPVAGPLWTKFPGTECMIARPDNHIKGTPKHTMGMNPMICLGKKSNPTQEVPYETIIRGFRPAQQQQFGRNH